MVVFNSERTSLGTRMYDCTNELFEAHLCELQSQSVSHALGGGERKS